MGTKSQRTKSINDLLDELKEQECQEGFMSGLFPRELHRIPDQYRSGSSVPVNTISQQQAR